MCLAPCRAVWLVRSPIWEAGGANPVPQWLPGRYFLAASPGEPDHFGAWLAGERSRNFSADMLDQHPRGLDGDV